MKLHDLAPADGAVKAPYRKGRGIGSGNGKTAGKGHKGQNARSGGGVRPGFEGGQMPLSRRLPKRGFSNYPFKVVYETVNVGVLNEFEDGTVVTAEELYAKNMISDTAVAVKILGDGEIEKKLTVKAAKFSESAKAKIEAAGGKAEVL